MTNPEGRLCKICIFTWVEGGFSVQYATIDLFTAQRRTTVQAQDEWDAASAEAVKILSEIDDSSRMGKVAKHKAIQRIKSQRDEIVEVYNTSKITCGKSFKGVDAKVYEKRHPGRIAETNGQ